MSDQFPEKHLKKIPTEFVDSVSSMDENEIKERILTCEQHLYEIDEAMDKDDKLNGAKENVKEFSKPYRETKQTESAKIKYCMFVLENRGVNLAKDDKQD